MQVAGRRENERRQDDGGESGPERERSGEEHAE
jgi:hypothetical protein